jgi:hypothetical protein
MEAAKHAIAGGATLAGIELEVSGAGDIPPVLMALPRPQWIPAKQVFSSLMATDDVRTRIQGMLPIWAHDANVSVVDDRAGERIAKISATVPSPSLALLDPGQLTHILEDAQTNLSNQGANIGRMIVRVEDSITKDPLYVTAEDVLWGYHGGWISPHAVGYLDAQRPAGSPQPPPPPAGTPPVTGG